MPGLTRRGRVLSGRVASKVGDMTRPCPVCGAAVGWRCVRKTRFQELPRAKVHPERLEQNSDSVADPTEGVK